MTRLQEGLLKKTLVEEERNVWMAFVASKTEESRERVRESKLTAAVRRRAAPFGKVLYFPASPPFPRAQQVEPRDEGGRKREGGERGVEKRG